MENMDVLVRGVVMQSPGIGVGSSISFQGLEWAWVAIFATIVIAFVSAKRVSIVSVGWTWGSKPGQVRVRVHSFSSMSDGSIVAASGMFSAEILNCSADSCSEDASSSSDCASEAASKVAAEMVFIFEKKTPSVMLLKQHVVASSRTFPGKIARKRTKSQDLQKLGALMLPSPLAIECSLPSFRSEGIQWDSSRASFRAFEVNTWTQSLTNPSLYRAPSPLPFVKNTASWDPLLKLRIHDAVVRDSYSAKELRTPIAPVAATGSRIVTLKDDVVRLWDTDSKSLLTRVHLPTQHSEMLTAFDGVWESKVAATARKGGLVSFANLESGSYTKSYQSHQSVVQAIHLDKSSESKTLFTGGPAVATPGCFVSLWDSRSSRSELSASLSSANNICGIRSQVHDLCVMDGAGYLSCHDVRMLGASSVRRTPCEKNRESPPEDRWWDIDDTTLALEEIDVEDEFWDCQATEELKTPEGAPTSAASSWR